jgi:hypothetical protein
MEALKAIQEIKEICQSVLVADRLKFTFHLGAVMQAKPVVQTKQAVKPWGAPKKTFKASVSVSTSNDADFDITGVTTVSVSVSPVDAAGNPSQATLSLENFVSDDDTVLTIVPDPSNPNGAIITFVGVGTASITATATATEPDGTTTEQIQGVGNVTLTESASGVAASLVFSYGTPA